MKIYVAVYSDYDCSGYVVGAFTNNEDAESFKNLYLEEIKYSDRYDEIGDYGERVKIEHIEILDSSYISRRLEKLKQRKKEKRNQREKIKEKDLAEFNRIKKKYNL